MGKTRQGLKYEPKDPGYQEAKNRGFVARSALKLEELDTKHRFYKKGMKILDLGCAPGSWLQYASEKVGAQGRLVGFDLDKVRVDLKNTETFVEDLFEVKISDERINSLLPFDLIQSDAMVKTSGIADSDCSRSVALVEHGLNLAKEGALKLGGTFIAKVFEGPGFTPFYVEFKKYFEKASVNKPDSIRQGSREVYLVGQGFRARKG
jgi:23S rRNA (uridine2552-2'-O)-methyltransferase